jgi:3-methylfumaryl-CoA hydratase
MFQGEYSAPGRHVAGLDAEFRQIARGLPHQPGAGAQFARSEDDAMDPAHGEFKAWIGRTEAVADVISATPYAALSATLDRPPVRPPAGTPLPPLWHWLYFLPLHAQSEIGQDGHAKRGSFLPPVSLQRRMWAGGQLDFRRALRVGDNVTRTSTIENVEAKTGRSGSLVFVRVRHEIRRNDESDVALLEIHDIVYREAAVPGASPPPPIAAPRDAAWAREVIPDDVLLFRYSALTFNGHRIHYDRRYVTEFEGYPGLIVHGPLIATLLLDLLYRQRPAAQVVRFEFKAIRPMFDVSRFHVCGTPAADGKSVHLWAQDHDGWLTMDAAAMLAKDGNSTIGRRRQR